MKITDIMCAESVQPTHVSVLDPVSVHILIADSRGSVKDKPGWAVVTGLPGLADSSLYMRTHNYLLTISQKSNLWP